MIHAQQKGYQPPEVLKGLCNAVVRNYRSTITKGKDIGERVAFIGGVAANTGAVAAMREAFETDAEHLIVPAYYAWMGAIGSALTAADEEAGVEMVAIDAGPSGTGPRGRLPDQRRPLHGARHPAARPGEALRVPGRGQGGRLPGHRHRLGLHQPGAARRAGRDGQGDLRQDRRPPGRGGQQGSGRDLERDGRAPRDPRAWPPPARAGSSSANSSGPTPSTTRSPPTRRGHLHRPQVHRPGARHHLRDRRPGLQVHQPRRRRRGGLRHERGLRRRHRLLPGGAGREAGHQHHRGVRATGAVVRGAGAPGRALHGVHGARRQLLPAAGRRQEEPSWPGWPTPSPTTTSTAWWASATSATPSTSRAAPPTTTRWRRPSA